MVQCFDVCIYYEVITIIKLISIFISLHSYFRCLCEKHVRYFIILVVFKY